MNGRLEKIKDWPLQAQRRGYRVEIVALQLRVSTRWLESYFKSRFSSSPHSLFAQWREREIRMLVKRGRNGKEIAAAVGFSHSSSLARSLTKNGGVSLRELRKTEP
jgi:AraC-like DNA-binding protein